MSGVQQITVSADDGTLRLDRWFKRHFPQVNHIRLEKLLRTGQVRVDGGRVKASHRLEPGQIIRVPPLGEAGAKAKSDQRHVKPRDAAMVQEAVIYKDDDLIVLNKPSGLAVQGGSGMVRHVDGMLEALQEREGQRPRLVHRLDRDTSGCLLVAKTRFAAAALAKTFRTRSARKLYWALVPGASSGEAQTRWPIVSLASRR